MHQRPKSASASSAIVGSAIGISTSLVWASNESPTQKAKILADKKKELLGVAELNKNFKSLLKPSWQPKIPLPGEDLKANPAKKHKSNVMKNHIHLS